MVKKISGALAAGFVAALLQCLGIQLLGHFHVQGMSVLGVSLAPRLTPAWLYPRLVWGAIWGLPLALPLLRDQTFWRGILLSLGPTLMIFLKYLPGMGKSLFGVPFGSLAPVMVLLLNFAWGLVAAYWYKQSLR